MARVLDRLRPAAIAVVLTLLVAPYVGMLWERIAPAPTYVNLSGEVYLDNQDTSAFIAADGWFLIIGFLAGVVAAGLAYWRWRGDLVVIVAMSLAGIAAAYIAREVGEAFGPPPIQQTALTLSDGETIDGALKLGADAVLYSWPVGVLLTYLSLIGGLERTSEDEEPDDQMLDAAWSEEFQGSSNGSVENGAVENGASVGAAGLAGDVGPGERGQVGEHDPLPAEKREFGA